MDLRARLRSVNNRVVFLVGRSRHVGHAFRNPHFGQKPFFQLNDQERASEMTQVLMRSRRASTVANTAASKSFYEMNMRSRRKRSSHSSDVENEMSPVPKKATSPLYVNTFSSSETQSTISHSGSSERGETSHKRRGRPRRNTGLSTPKGNKRGLKDNSNGVKKPVDINQECPWAPMGDPVEMNVLYQNDQRPERRACFTKIRHKNMPEEFCSFDVISVGIESEVNGLVEKSIGIGKVSCFFYDDLGNLSINLFWYYSPQDAVFLNKKSKGPKDEEMEIPRFHDRELLASKHVDVVPVESIEGHAYVLTLPEYNRFVPFRLSLLTVSFVRFVADCMLDDLPTYLKQKREAVCPLSTDDYPSERLLPSELTPDSPAVFLSRYAWSFQHHKILRGEQFKKYQPWGRSNNSSKLKSSSPKRT
ncbi:hypothetical protein L596_027467 [Steinernema carpocapsae]|uniref:BAH domain-containing protein n=1 Tax=Steinernema carpocapsae TaxID=34508 RepID=A0A4U5LVI3_STECR|nr:hypothetical protein L596_027467 [Steinernema carpocapsae]